MQNIAKEFHPNEIRYKLFKQGKATVPQRIKAKRQAISALRASRPALLLFQYICVPVSVIVYEKGMCMRVYIYE